jgi:ribose 5-phosphate isomerase B
MSFVFDASKPIAIGSDHAGFEYKEAIKKWLTHKGYQVHDFGAPSLDSVDYPDFAHPTAASVASGESTFGILICGSANGVAMTANKHQSIRAALCWTEEIAELARKHNDANVLCIPARFVTVEVAENMIELFMNTSFEGGRHQSRVDKISC